MIQSKITVGDKVITADQFPEAAALTKVSEDGIRTTYYDNEYISNLLTENRVGRFLLLSQSARSFADCELEIRRTGIPVLMMTLAKNSDMVRTRQEDRHWRTGDVCLSLFPEEDIVVNHCRAGGTFELFNIVLTEPVVRQLAERHPEALNPFCKDFERNESIAYTPPGTQANRKLLRLFQDIEDCNEMGNYAEKYLETQILDCLSMMINSVNESDDTFSPVNLVLSDKVHEAREIMTTQYQNPPSLHQLATMVGTNECTLKSAFKQEFGETVFQCLFDHRMSLAVNYLKDTSWPIAEIGLLLGYEYQSHFCTAFRRKYGMSPTDFRESCGYSVK
ncbi:MAG: helix-turn-helix transcriptional regulator [Bacteroidales bacterium]|nr:helix-turn-helix transcriptional regulator [Bacteroidales bacterium]